MWGEPHDKMKEGQGTAAKSRWSPEGIPTRMEEEPKIAKSGASVGVPCLSGGGRPARKIKRLPRCTGFESSHPYGAQGPLMDPINNTK